MIGRPETSRGAGTLTAVVAATRLALDAASVSVVLVEGGRTWIAGADPARTDEDPADLEDAHLLLAQPDPLLARPGAVAAPSTSPVSTRPAPRPWGRSCAAGRRRRPSPRSGA